MLRRAWGRLLRKQWLILYPLALSVIDTLAFLAVYSIDGGTLRWSAFFTANFDRWQYASDHFLTQFSFSPALAAAVLAGLATCLFAALVRAPYFRAITGPTYPLAPRKWREAYRLFLFYLFYNLVVWVAPLAAPTGGFLAQLVMAAIFVVWILVAFADYVIVYEDLPFLRALRRSVRLLSRRWVAVVVIFVVLSLVSLGISGLYGLYYRGNTAVFALFPLSQMLVESAITLLLDLILIFLYEDIRRRSPA